MKRIFFTLPLTFAMVTQALAAPTVAVPEKTHSAHPTSHAAHPKPVHAVTAPADEYFGHQKMSILGIRNTLHDLNVRYDGSVARAPMLFSGASQTEDAMRDWDHKYHGDLWLAHYLFQLDNLYMRVPTAEGKSRVNAISTWIIDTYPNTYYSKYLKNIAKNGRSRALATEPPLPSASPQGTLLPASAAPSIRLPSFDPSAAPAATTSPVPAPTRE